LKSTIHFSVNGEPKELEVDSSRTLLDVLRNELGLTGAKSGCEAGDCGSCTVLIDGKPYNSCLVLVPKVDGKEITTIEGMSKDGKLHPIQEAFIDHGAIQCGYCTPGMVLSAKSLLDQNPNPSEEEIRQGMSGNLCRCTGYKKIVEAIKSAAEEEAEN
jgi:carbon-monoxide dehydrogenase small subunit